MKVIHILAGRRESALLAYPSVQRMAEILAWRCREESWVRGAVASLARFSALTGYADLEALRLQALAEPVRAEQALAIFAGALAHHAESQVATLAMGAKLWFRLNGVAVPWRPLPGRSVVRTPVSEQPGVEPVILLALIGSGLNLAELLRLRIGDVGSLDVDGHLIPDLLADPLAVQYTPRRGKQRERITFLSYQARQALMRWLEPTRTSGKLLDPALPLLTRPDGSPIARASVARARQRGRALIQAGNNANVELCRATGDFFRSWGMPGARFTGPEELNGEDYF
jgi:hypothetical protein